MKSTLILFGKKKDIEDGDRVVHVDGAIKVACIGKIRSDYDCINARPERLKTFDCTQYITVDKRELEDRKHDHVFERFRDDGFKFCHDDIVTGNCVFRRNTSYSFIQKDAEIIQEIVDCEVSKEKEPLNAEISRLETRLSEAHEKIMNTQYLFDEYENKFRRMNLIDRVKFIIWGKSEG